MKPTERDDLIRSFFEDDMALLTAKGHDYAGTDDCLRNLSRHGLRGIIVRMGDKYERLHTLVWDALEPEVKGEAISDTLRDLRNYSFLAQIFLEGKEKP
jgi:hypothetical protein